METIRLQFKRLNTTFNYEKPGHFCVSQWQSSNKSVVYVMYRWFIALFFIFSVATSIIYAILRNQVLVYFIYLTNWNLNMTMVMTCMSAWHATLFYKEKIELKKTMPKNMKIFWFLSSTTTMSAILISVMYWTVLYKPGKNSVDLNNILIHGTNSIILVIDLFVVKQPARFGLYVYSFMFGVVYLIFTWIYPALGGLNK